MTLRGLPPEVTRVTPTRRLAHDLRTRFDSDRAASGLAVWRTIDVVTWDDLIERMFMLDRQAGRATGRWMSASAAQFVWDRIVRDDTETPPLVSASGAARAAYASWRRMHDYAIPRSGLEGEGTPEGAAFARWCDRYTGWLAAHESVDVSLAQQMVRPVAAGPGLEFVGFDRYTPAQAALLGRWGASGLEVRHAEASLTKTRATKVACRDRVAEFEAAARWAADLLDRGAVSRVAIIVPDLARDREEVRRVVDRVMSPATGLTGGPPPASHRFELAAARPLAEQPIVAAALDLLETFTGFPDAPALSRLLRNPFLLGADAESAARARLDAYLRRNRGATGIGLAHLARVAAERACPTLAQSVANALGIIEKWSKKAVPSIYVNNVFMLLDALGWGGTSLDSAEHQAEQRWRQLVAEFAALDEATGAVSQPGATQLLRDFAGRVLFEPEEIQSPLLVIDPDTCAGMRFDAAWVCGLDAARWPRPAAPDPFLPLALQKRQGVPRASAELARREAREMLDRLLRSASEVVLSAPLTEDDAPLLPSPLLAEIAQGDVGRGWPEPRVAVALFQGRPPLESLLDNAMPSLRPEEASSGGVRLLELQSACPFRAQAEFRLGGVALDDPDPGVGAAERGDLVHTVLARVWLDLGNQAALHALDPADTTMLVRRSVAAALDLERASADEVRRHLLDLEAGWLEARVLEILEIDRARDRFSVASVETPSTLRLGRLALEMRPDRVDRLEDGSLAVIDYKTGADAEVRAWLDERPRLPQLPAYAQSLGFEGVAAVAFARIRSGDTGYAGLARSAMNFPGVRVVGGQGARVGFDSWQQLNCAWQRRLESLAGEYAAGDARLAPDPGRACRYCHLGALCRIAEARLDTPAEDHDE